MLDNNALNDELLDQVNGGTEGFDFTMNYFDLLSATPPESPEELATRKAVLQRFVTTAPTQEAYAEAGLGFGLEYQEMIQIQQRAKNMLDELNRYR